MLRSCWPINSPPQALDLLRGLLSTFIPALMQLGNGRIKGVEIAVAIPVAAIGPGRRPFGVAGAAQRISFVATKTTEDRVRIGSLLTSVEDGSDIAHERVGPTPQMQPAVSDSNDTGVGDVSRLGPQVQPMTERKCGNVLACSHFDVTDTAHGEACGGANVFHRRCYQEANLRWIWHVESLA
jgi:hypothetical protein